MLRNYFTIAVRNLRKNRLHSFINLAGLSIGLACCVLICIYVRHELSYDRYNKKSAQIYRLTEILHMPKTDNARAVSSAPMGPAIKANFPEVVDMARINYSSRDISYNEQKHLNAKIIYADSTFFNIFSFSMLSGDALNALEKPYSIVLTESTSKKYFGNDEPVGKTMYLSDTIPLKVTAVINDVPDNSHFAFDCILSRSTFSEMNHREPETAWFGNAYYTYLLLQPAANAQVLEKKITGFIRKEMTSATKESGLYYDLKLQPLTDIHLRSSLNAEIQPNSNISYIYIFSAAALLILLIACSNFINLSTAKSLERTKEIGLRKTVGALRSQLIVQFLGESFFLCLVASLGAFFIVYITLPWFNHLAGMKFSPGSLFDPALIALFMIILILVSIAAGLYPALLLSSFRPVLALKESINGRRHLFLKKGLVVFQFTIAIILIIGTAVMYQQLNFIQHRNIGVQKEQVLQVDLPLAFQGKGKILQTELQKAPHVLNSSLTDFNFSFGISSIAVLPEGASQNEVNSLPVISVDENFLSTFGASLVSGRNFSHSYPTDPDQAFMLNETAARNFGWTAQSALGKGIDWGLGKKGKVIGVVKDFNFASLHENVRPLILHIEPSFYGFLSVRFNPASTGEALKEIEAGWKNAGIPVPMKYSFLDEDFLTLYKSEKKMQDILSIFTVLSIFVAALGIFGLTAFTLRQRIKEIGVRKVLGANTSNIVWLFSREFLVLVLISLLIASVIASTLMNKWLEDFAYHVQLSGWIFAMAGALTLIVAFATVGALAFRASRANPVRNLRSE